MAGCQELTRYGVRQSWFSQGCQKIWSHDFLSYGSKQVKTGQHDWKTGSAMTQQAMVAQLRAQPMHTRVQSVTGTNTYANM